QQLLSKRLVESEYGRLDPEEWESRPSAPVTFKDCLKVALHLQATQTHFSKMFLDVVRLKKIQELLRGLVKYFGELFLQADIIRGIEAPSVGNERALRQRWQRCLSAVLDPLATTYGLVILGQGLENLHHMKRGRSLHSYSSRDNHIFERLYELAELLVWVVFRRRDRSVIHAEVIRLFRGKLGLEQQQNKQLQQLHQQMEDAGEQVQKLRLKEPPISAVTHEKSGLMTRTVPDMEITKTISSWFDTLAPLTYVSE
ncbi:hypothetical protein SK128_014181, partial [Halocaridina rubra]